MVKATTVRLRKLLIVEGSDLQTMTKPKTTKREAIFAEGMYSTYREIITVSKKGYISNVAVMMNEELTPLMTLMMGSFSERSSQ